MDNCDLKGCGILVTRAVHQARTLAQQIEACHGRAVLLPAIDIQPLQDQGNAVALLQQPWDWMIFVSPNAVRYTLQMEVLNDRQQAAGIGAVGESTAKLLQQAGLSVDLLPQQGYDSEGLLSLPELVHAQGKRVLIIRGKGGRPLLGDTLKARGAKVSYAEVYQRVRPDIPVISLLQSWKQDIQLVTTTSNEVLKNLVVMLGEVGWSQLSQTPLLVISERMQHEAQRLGFDKVIRASGADDQSLMAAICTWADGNEPQ
ncbi:MAG: uroporphyrinogen-III synthase [Candidatus Thiodiazotropha sp.]|jgi:uroporphyrinogen-III synthase